MSDTPRTDAARKHAFTNSGMRSESVVPVSLAYELERELAQRTADLAKANAERDEARRKLCEADANHNMIFFDHSINGYATNTPQRVARLRGWDCFEKEANQ